MAGTRNLEQAPVRAALKLWQGFDVTGFEQPPDLVNGESLLSINNAGSGTTALIGSNASDQVLVGGDVAVRRIHYSILIPVASTAGNFAGVIVPGLACQLTSVNERHETAGSDGSAVTVMVKKVPSGTARASGTDMLAAGVNMKATADTVQSPALHATVGNLQLAATDGVALVLTGTPTALAGLAFEFAFKPI